jgi:hypothetical protein
MVHYDPEYQADSLLPFSHPASSWGMDKPIMVGRFPAASWSTSMIGPNSSLPLKSTEAINDAFSYTYSNGYAGALSWAMGDSTSYTTTAPALTALYTAHKTDIMIKDVVIQTITGNYAMQVTFKNVPGASGSTGYYELGTTLSKDFTGKTNLLVDMLVKSGSSTNIQLTPVIKVTSAYTWSPDLNNIISLGNVPQGVWITDTIPIANFGATSVSNVRELLFQWSASGSSYDSGTIYFDNFRADGDTIANFNVSGSTWTINSDSAKTSLIKFSDVPVVATVDTSNYAMKYTLKNVPGSGYYELGTTISKNFTGKTNLLFDIFVKTGSSTNLQFIPVLKVDSTYTWSPAANNTLYLSSVTPGQWFTDTVPIANFGAANLTDVRQLLFQWSTQGSPYDSGVIYFDNVRVDNDTLCNFNTPGITWTSSTDSAKLSLVKLSDIPTAIKGKPLSFIKAAGRFELSVRNKTLFLRLSKSMDTKISVFNVTGKTVASIDRGNLSAGSYAVSLKGLSAGSYIVEIGKGSARIRSNFIVQ